jgi:hypothetical protein
MLSLAYIGSIYSQETPSLSKTKKPCAVGGEASEMAADVSALVRVLNGYSKEDQHRAVGNDSSCEKSTALITRDLLGGSSSSSTSKLVESQELDLDLQVPNGWEKRLDLKVRPFSHLGLFLYWEILLFPHTFFFFEIHDFSL